MNYTDFVAQATKLAKKEEHTKLKQYLLEWSDCWDTEHHEVLHNAVKYGSIKTLQFLIELQNDTSNKISFAENPAERIVWDAVEYGKLDTLKKFLAVCRPTTRDLNKLLCLTVQYNQKATFDFLMTLNNQQCESICQISSIDPFYLRCLVQFGLTTFLRELVAHKNITINSGVLCSAIQSGKLAVVRFLLEYKLDSKPLYTIKDSDSYLLEIAAKRGHFEIVKYLAKFFGGAVRCKAFAAAIEKGKLDVVRYFVETHKIYPNDNHMNIAIDSDKAKIVKYFTSLTYENGYKLFSFNAITENYVPKAVTLALYKTIAFFLRLEDENGSPACQLSRIVDAELIYRLIHNDCLDGLKYFINIKDKDGNSIFTRVLKEGDFLASALYEDKEDIIEYLLSLKDASGEFMCKVHDSRALKSFDFMTSERSMRALVTAKNKYGKSAFELIKDKTDMLQNLLKNNEISVVLYLAGLKGADGNFICSLGIQNTDLIINCIASIPPDDVYQFVSIIQARIRKGEAGLVKLFGLALTNEKIRNKLAIKEIFRTQMLDVYERLNLGTSKVPGLPPEIINKIFSHAGFFRDKNKNPLVLHKKELDDMYSTLKELWENESFVNKNRKLVSKIT